MPPEQRRQARRPVKPGEALLIGLLAVITLLLLKRGLGFGLENNPKPELKTFNHLGGCSACTRAERPLFQPFKLDSINRYRDRNRKRNVAPPSLQRHQGSYNTTMKR